MVDGARWGDVPFILILGVWYVVSILHQLPGTYFTWVKNRNVFLLIPGWTFFAPNPGVSNYRYVFRDSYPDGTQGEWEEINWCEHRRFTHAFWNPGRLRTKLIVDCINGLTIMVKDLDKRGVDFREHPQTYMVSTPYLALLHIATQMPSSRENPSGRQFAIIEQSSYSSTDAPRLIVCSPMHERH
jgi:hypothetical protein